MRNVIGTQSRLRSLVAAIGGVGTGFKHAWQCLRLVLLETHLAQLELRRAQDQALGRATPEWDMQITCIKTKINALYARR